MDIQNSGFSKTIPSKYGLIFYKLKSNDTNNIVNEFNINLGLHSKRFEFKIGYRFFKIIREKLNGPEVCIVVWF